MKHILAILSLIPALAFGQASLGVNKTTGAINSPVSATTFRDANAVGSQADVVLVHDDGKATPYKAAADTDAARGAALTTAWAALAPGDTMIIAPGTFQIAARLGVDVSNVTVRGQGPALTTI